MEKSLKSVPIWALSNLKFINLYAETTTMGGWVILRGNWAGSYTSLSWFVSVNPRKYDLPHFPSLLLSEFELRMLPPPPHLCKFSWFCLYNRTMQLPLLNKSLKWIVSVVIPVINSFYLSACLKLLLLIYFDSVPYRTIFQLAQTYAYLLLVPTVLGCFETLTPQESSNGEQTEWDWGTSH